MNEETLINIRKLRPFTRFIYTIGELPTSYLMSMTYEEQLVWFCNYLEKTVIPTIDNNGQAVEELQNLYIELKNYVDNYFENLDVQEEINNKLDEMVEDGTLESIISEYLELKSIFQFNTVNEMLNSTYLINGSFTHTSGFYSLNDGGGADYYIRTKTIDDTADNIHLFDIVNDNTLVAELIDTKKINILQLGAKTTEDATTIINYALTNFDEVIIPEGTFNVTDSLILNSFNYLHGLNHNSKINMNRSYNVPMLLAQTKNNIKIENITLKNNEVDTSSGVPIHRIGTFEGCENIEIINCYITNVWSIGLVFKGSGFITIKDSTFYDVGHTMLSFLTETHDILVDNCIFDTVEGTNSNPYLLQTGSDDFYTEVEYLTKNMTVQNCLFKNNPLWEGLESHGCSNFRAYNNRIENCLQGIHVYFDDRTPTTTHDYENVIIENNIIHNLDNQNLQYGIIVGGTQEYFLNNVIIKNNIVIGGMTTSSNSIYVLYSNYFTIDNNDLSRFSFQAITTQYCTNGNITNNYIHNSLALAGGISIGTNAWLVRVENNTINGGGLISRCITTANAKGLGILGHNICYGYTQYKYYMSNNNNTLVDKSDITVTNRLGCHGIYSIDQNDRILMYCTDDVIRSIAETSSAKATGTAGSNIIESTNAIAYLCPGQEIVIAGAGADSNDLTTVIQNFIGKNKFTIKDNLVASVTGADISTTASTWVAE